MSYSQNQGVRHTGEISYNCLREIQKSKWKAFDPPTQNHRNQREIQKSCTCFQLVSDPSHKMF